MKPETDILNNLFNNGRTIELAKGEVLHDVHEKCRALGKLVSGKIRLSRILSSGREIIMKEFEPGEIYAELRVFTGEKFPGWLIASEDSAVIEVEFHHVAEYLKDPEALVSYMSGISDKTNHLTDKIEILSLKTVKQKIAFSLLARNEISIVSISELADHLACSREALSRALSEMEQEKMIKRQGKVIRTAESFLLEELL